MTQTVLTKLRSLPDNNRCCDCGAVNPQWTSITMSSLVCVKCAGTHHSLGVLVSQMKSLKLCSWSTPQIVRMLAGGNARLQAALESNSAKWSATGEPLSVYTAHARYKSKNAAAYTCALDCKCGERCERDDDEAPDFGVFLLERSWQSRQKQMGKLF